jgi:glycosyltransferase involved in cell wall biosynthesis
MSMSTPPLHVVSVQTTAEKGGAEYSNVDHLEGLADRGMQVRLFTNLPEIARDSKVPVQVVDLGPKLSTRTVARVALGFGPWLLRLLRTLRRERAEHGPVDVLLVHYKKEQLMAALVPRRLARAVVWAEWGPVPMELRRGLPRVAYRLAARRAARIVAISEGTKRSIVDVGVPADKIEVLPNAVDVEAIDFDPAARERLRGEWGAGPDTFVACCVSRLHPKKRNDVLVRALEHMDGDVLLVLAGHGDEEPRLRELAAPYGDRVRFIPTPRGYIWEVMSGGDVALFSPAPTEGSPIVVVMAQLARRPVVATGPEGVREMVVPGTGTIVEPSHDPVALARVLEEYRDDPERRASEGEQARERAVHRYDRRRIEDALAELLRSAAANS